MSLCVSKSIPNMFNDQVTFVETSSSCSNGVAFQSLLKEYRKAKLLTTTGITTDKKATMRFETLCHGIASFHKEDILKRILTFITHIEQHTIKRTTPSQEGRQEMVHE